MGKRNRKKHHSRNHQSGANKQPQKQRDYKSNGATAKTNQYALTTERIRLIAIIGVSIIGLIVGVVMIFKNITDPLFELEFANVKLKASLVGVAISLVSIWGLFKFNPITEVNNEK